MRDTVSRFARNPILVVKSNCSDVCIKRPGPPPGTMHANYRAAIMARSCSRQTRENTSLCTRRRRSFGCKMEVCSSVTKGCSFQKRKGGSRKDRATSAGLPTRWKNYRNIRDERGWLEARGVVWEIGKTRRMGDAVRAAASNLSLTFTVVR